MPWTEYALEGIALLGMAVVGGLVAVRCQHPVGALVGFGVAISASAAAVGCFKRGAGVACRQLPQIESYCRALI